MALLLNPIAKCFEFILQIYSLLPFAIKALVSVSLGLFLATCVISLFFRIR